MPSSSAPTILCAGIAVQDIVFRVEQFPQPGGKCMTNEFIVVSGGCAVNAAIAVARLGGRAHYAGPLGDLSDNVSNQLMAEMAREGIDTTGVVRVAGATAPVSGIMVDAAGERMIVTHRDKRIETARIADPDRLVAECFAAAGRQPLSRAGAAGVRGGAAARHPDRARRRPADGRGRSAVCAFRPTSSFPANACAPPPGWTICPPGSLRMAPRTEAFLAVSDGPGAVRYIADGEVRTMPVFKIEAIDTLAAGDVFHAGIALALAEGRDAVSAMRFGAAAAGLKCTRFGGSMGAPKRAEVEAFLAKQG